MPHCTENPELYVHVHVLAFMQVDGEFLNCVLNHICML